MLQPLTTTVHRRTPLAPAVTRRLWILLWADVMAAVWMFSAGAWLDAHQIAAVLTFGGHHLLVLFVAGLSFWALAVLAAFTGGFSTVTPLQSVLISIAAVTSLMALAGVVSVILLIVGGGLFLGTVARLLR